MLKVLSKFWILGGWFYLSLVLAVALFYTGNKKYNKHLCLVVLICAAVLAIYYSYKQFVKLNFAPSLFFRPIAEKLDSGTAGQYAYSLHLKEILPQDTKGCIIWSWDLPTYYLRNELYPRVFAITAQASNSCVYIISQFAPQNVDNFRLIDKYQDNYLYQREN